MADLTPKIGLKKPVVNVETDWGSRLNESLDILDGTLLTANTSAADGLEIFDDGGGNVTISGNRSEMISISGSLRTDIDDNSTRITTTSGHLQGQIDGIDASVTLQEAYDNGTGFITTVSGKPVVISGAESDFAEDFRVVGSGTFTEGLTIGTSTLHLEPNRITTSSGVFTEGCSIGNDADESEETFVFKGKGRFKKKVKFGKSTTEIDEFGLVASGVTVASGCFTETIEIGPPGQVVVLSGSDTGGVVTATGIFQEVNVDNIVIVGDPLADDAVVTTHDEVSLPNLGRISNYGGPGFVTITLVDDALGIEAETGVTVTGTFSPGIEVADPFSSTRIDSTSIKTHAMNIDTAGGTPGILSLREDIVDNEVVIDPNSITMSGAAPNLIVKDDLPPFKETFIDPFTVVTSGGIFPGSLTIPVHFTDPTPAEGDVWINGTSSGIRWHVGGTTYEVIGTPV